MKEIMNQFDKFMRYYIAGVIFIIVIAFRTNNWTLEINNFSLNYIYIFIPFIPGTIIYAIHRNFIGVLIEWFRRCLIKIFKCLKIILPKCEWNGMLIRWDAKFKNYQIKKETVIKHLKIWGDHVQLLYTTGLAILLGEIIPRFFDIKIHNSCSCKILYVCLILYLIGLFADIRKQLAEDFIDKF
jgi:hypothetical protein